MSDLKETQYPESSSDLPPSESVSPARRRLLQAASLSGIALLVSACTRSDTDGEGGVPAELQTVDEFCQLPGEPGNPSESDIDEIAEELWSAFDRGTISFSKEAVMPLAKGVKENRQEHHTVIVKQNWSKLSRCRRLTGQCAFNTGVVAAAMATSAGTSEISKKVFILAADAVFEMQRNRAGGKPTFTGIAC